MKNLFKITALVLFAAMLLSLAACTDPHQPAVSDPTQEAGLPDNTEPVTEAPTAEPTAEPAAEATEDGYDPEGEMEDPITTNDPDAAEKQMEWSRRVKETLNALGETPLSSCAVKIASFVPNSPNGPYYEYIKTENGEDELNFASHWLSVDGSKLYINDRFRERTLFVFDTETGTASRIGYEQYVGLPTQMIVIGGRMFTHDGADDLETGETINFTSPLTSSDINSDTWFMTAYDGIVRMYVQSDRSKANEDGSCPSVIYTLNAEENEWSEGETVAWNNELFSSESVTGILPNGNYCLLQHLIDDEGFWSERRIVLADSEGNPLAYTEMPYSLDEIHASDYSEGLIAAPDGYIYYIACLADEVAVWRIDLN